MPSRLNPYVNFRNTARQAMEFYKGVFGGTLTMNTFGEFQSAKDPADKDKIMHAQLEAPNGFVLMGSDLSSGVPYKPGSNVTISLSGDNEAELSGFWKKLTVGGTITQPAPRRRRGATASAWSPTSSAPTGW